MMKGKNWSSFYCQQDTITLLRSSSDSIADARKESNSLVQKNTIKVLINTPEQSIVNLNQPKDSIENQPLFIKIEFNDKSLIDNYKEENLLSINQDSNCYIVNKQANNSEKPIFYLEKSESKTSIKKDFIVKEKINAVNDWTIIPILLGMFLLASIVTVYRKYLGVLFESIVYRFSSNKILNEKNSQFKRLTLFLDFLFII